MSSNRDIGPLQSGSGLDIGPLQSAGGPTPVNRSVADSITLSDAILFDAACFAVLNDSLSFLDTQTLYGPDDSTPFVFTDDSIFLLDGINLNLSSLGFLTESVADSFTITDSTSGSFAGLFVSVSDILTFLDNFNYLTATAADSFSITDQVVGMLVTIIETLSDTLTLSDAFQVLDLKSSDGSTIEAAPNSDSITLSDLESQNVGIPIDSADSITLSDVDKLLLGCAIVESDTLTFSDSIGIANPFNRSVADIISLRDLVQSKKSNAQGPVTDTVSLIDSTTLILEMQTPASASSVSFSDQVALELTIDFAFSDTFSLTDSNIDDNVNTPIINKQFGDGLSIGDTIVVLDAPIFYVIVTDSFQISDSISQTPISDLNPYLRRYLNDVV